MERIETLLKRDMGSEFDTRKTLNRSDIKVPDAILDQIESGSFTCEMINELAKTFPIFRYQTQITIHGQFDVTNSRIAGYKNIFQNGNLSLGIKYSAIDTEKIEKIRELLDKVQPRGAGLDSTYFYFLRDSQHRLFRRSKGLTKETFEGLKTEYMQLAEKIKEVSIYGYVDCYVTKHPFLGNQIVLDVHPLAIPNEKVMELVCALSNLTQEEYTEKAQKYDEILAEKKRLRAIEEYEIKEKQKEFEERRSVFAKLFKTENFSESPVGLSLDNPVICKLNIKENAGCNPEFVFLEYVFYKIAGKGAFGKYKIQRGTSLVADHTKVTNWEDYKQQKKLSEIKLKGHEVKLPVKAVQPTSWVPDTVEIVEPITKTDGIYIIDYSDKAIAVLGDTKQYKEILGKNGLRGSFNYALTVGTERVCGWIFPKTRKEEVKQKLGL
jgi:hypothetical protein